MDENKDIQEDLGNGGKIKNWLQDNIRIILSVLIVLTIAAGIYSYSKRTVTTVENGDNGAEVIVKEGEQGKEVAKNDKKDEEENNAVVVVGEDEGENKIAKEDKNKEESKKLSVQEVANNDENNNSASDKNKETQQEIKNQPENQQKEEVKVAQKDETNNRPKEQQAVVRSEESQDAFTEVAAPGDSLTVLARRATKHYLEKNPEDGLTKEHLIYIEDYLRKHVQHSGSVRPGEKVSFSKDLIKEAIGSAKNLNQAQLRNLQKYSKRVSSL